MSTKDLLVTQMVSHMETFYVVGTLKWLKLKYPQIIQKLEENDEEITKGWEILSDDKIAELCVEYVKKMEYAVNLYERLGGRDDNKKEFAWKDKRN